MYGLIRFKEKKETKNDEIKDLAFDEPNYCCFVHREVWKSIYLLNQVEKEQKMLSRAEKAEEKSGEERSTKKSKQKDWEPHWSNLTLPLLQCCSH